MIPRWQATLATNEEEMAKLRADLEKAKARSCSPCQYSLELLDAQQLYFNSLECSQGWYKITPNFDVLKCYFCENRAVLHFNQPNSSHR